MDLVLSNAQHPEYGVLTVPFPIPRDQYDGIIEMLEELEIGDAVARDCRVDQVSDEYPILKRLKKTAVNIDEMDYLAKRLGSFCDQEVAQFQAMAVKLGTFDMTDLINLTFYCQQATVITDFSNLTVIGVNHILTLRGGSCSLDEMAQALEDGEKTALSLILNEEGRITPYGVVYDNGMKLEQLYDGRRFPDHDHGDTVLAVTMTNRTDLTGTETYVYLPVPERMPDCILRWAGIQAPDEGCLKIAYSRLPGVLDRVLQGGNETLESLAVKNILDIRKSVWYGSGYQTRKGGEET